MISTVFPTGCAQAMPTTAQLIHTPSGMLALLAHLWGLPWLGTSSRVAFGGSGQEVPEPQAKVLRAQQPAVVENLWTLGITSAAQRGGCFEGLSDPAGRPVPMTGSIRPEARQDD